MRSKSDVAQEAKEEATGRLVVGVFFFFLSLYALSGPGRIDMIDGEFRFDVAWNLVDQGRPIVRDPFLRARTGIDGARYSFYGPAGSIASVPLVWLGYLLGKSDGELARFLFNFTSAFFGAASLALLVSWWTRLGISRRRATFWALVVGCTSLLWPTSTSVFDQSQHAFFVLASVYAGTRSTESKRSLAWSMLSGTCAGVLLLYQIPYLLFAPVLALSLLDRESPRKLRLALPRFLLFALPWMLCLTVWAAYNIARFGSPADIGALPGHPLFGNPIVGLADLLVSPGKGIIWYSPIVVLQIAALPTLWRKFRALALPAGAMAVSHLLFISSMSFHGGDWCWGPRYLVTTLPLLSVGLPFLSLPQNRRWLMKPVIVAGAVVQLLAISMDHQGFFFAHSLRPWFWTDSTANFRRSQLAYRAKEIVGAISAAEVDMQRTFRPGPYPTLPTYAIFGPAPSIDAAEYPAWMKAYPVFQVPRPWPLWMSRLPANRRPVAIAPTASGLLAILALGMIYIRRSFREQDSAENGSQA